MYKKHHGRLYRTKKKMLLLLLLLLRKHCIDVKKTKIGDGIIPRPNCRKKNNVRLRRDGQVTNLDDSIGRPRVFHLSKKIDSFSFSDKKTAGTKRFINYEVLGVGLLVTPTRYCCSNCPFVAWPRLLSDKGLNTKSQGSG